jgi:NH3-dependent NAD+ synthetase
MSFGRSAVVCASTGMDFAVVAVIAANAAERRRSHFVSIEASRQENGIGFLI